MIIVNDKQYETLDDPIYANGKLVKEVYVNGDKVYPDDYGTGVIRFTLIWNDALTPVFNRNDEDLHCITPDGKIEIDYTNMKAAGGYLDVDVIRPIEGKKSVENIFFNDLNNMPFGTYKFYIHTFSFRNGIGGFRCELYVKGHGTRYYNYPHTTSDKLITYVAKLTLHDDYSIDIEDILPPSYAPFY